jgi:hypothetical protein
MRNNRLLKSSMAAFLGLALLGGAGLAHAVDNPCASPAAVATTPTDVCAIPGNVCNATTVTIGVCTSLAENTKFDFAHRDLIVASGGTLQINPMAVDAPGEVAPWLTIEAGTFTVQSGGTVRGTAETSSGANQNPTVIRLVADTGDFLEEQGGLIISADRGIPGAHIIITTIASLGHTAPGTTVGNITIAGELRANVQPTDIGGDPVWGGKIFLSADDPTAAVGGKITIAATANVVAGATDPGAAGIFMAACNGIDIFGHVITQGKTGKNPVLEPFFGNNNPLIFKINNVAAGIDEPLFLTLARFGGPFNPTTPAPNNPPLPLDNLGAAMSTMAASAGGMVYMFSHEELLISGASAQVESNINIPENAPFQVGLVAGKARGNITVTDHAIVQTNGAPPNAGFIDLVSTEGSATFSVGAIVQALPLNFAGLTSANNIAGKINVRANLNVTYKDAGTLIQATGQKGSGTGGVINLQSFAGDVVGSAGATIDATGAAGNGTVTFTAPAPGPTGGGNVTPAAVKVQAAGTAPDTIARCVGACGCIVSIQKVNSTVKVTGDSLDAITKYFYKTNCDPTGCPNATCIQATVAPGGTPTSVTLNIPAGTPANSHVIGVSDTGTFCTTQTFSP